MKKLDVLKIFIVFAMICGFVSRSTAQSSDRQWAIGIYGSLFEYKGDFGSEFFSFDFDEIEGGGGLTISKYLSPSFNLIGDFSMGELNASGDGEDAGKRFHSTIFSTNINLVYKFNNGYILDEDFFVQPFVSAGVGGVYSGVEGVSENYGSYHTKKKVITPGEIYAGLGVKFKTCKAVSVVLQSGFHQTLSDRVDGENRMDDGYDSYLEHSLGVEVSFADAKDSDGDGIPDSRDRCPETPEGAEVDRYGCPMDSDKDGIADYADSCPDVPGLIKFNGCPDTDGDGIIDSEDKCPDEFGLKRFEGCPDTDKDGIGDIEDECPNDKGPLEMNGCPCDYKPIDFCGDDDNDGVSNAKDKCPDTPEGIKVDEDGCPLDSDNDGVPDYKDKCPDVAGQYDGCPDELTGLGTMIDTKNINFDTNKATLRPESELVLDEIAKILQEHPNYNLELSGYTDDRATESYNLDLSKRRAASCRDYLVKKGVSVSRVKAEGYGETNFVATNSTEEGRQKNRRVEFKINIK